MILILCFCDAEFTNHQTSTSVFQVRAQLNEREAELLEFGWPRNTGSSAVHMNQGCFTCKASRAKDVGGADAAWNMERYIKNLFVRLHPGRLPWTLKNHWLVEEKLFFQGVIVRVYVSFSG